MSGENFFPLETVGCGCYRTAVGVVYEIERRGSTSQARCVCASSRALKRRCHGVGAAHGRSRSPSFAISGRYRDAAFSTSVSDLAGALIGAKSTSRPVAPAGFAARIHSSTAGWAHRRLTLRGRSTTISPIASGSRCSGELAVTPLNHPRRRRHRSALGARIRVLGSTRASPSGSAHRNHWCSRSLIVVFLRGGADGRVSRAYREDAYYCARRRTAVARLGRAKIKSATASIRRAVRPASALHPLLPWESGELRFV